MGVKWLCDDNDKININVKEHTTIQGWHYERKSISMLFQLSNYFGAEIRGVSIVM